MAVILGFACTIAWIIDGDTFICSTGRHVRIAGIDAPELAGHCAEWRRCTPGDAGASLRNLIRIAKGRDARCEAVGRSYDRTLAFCAVPGPGWRGWAGHKGSGAIDLGCAQVTGGYAVKRYSFAPYVCRHGYGSATVSAAHIF